MRGASALVFSVVWLIIVMMVGFIVTSNLQAHANDSGTFTENATATAAWTNFMNFVWIAFGILAMTPLISVAVIFMGIFQGATD